MQEEEREKQQLEKESEQQHKEVQKPQQKTETEAKQKPPEALLQAIFEDHMDPSLSLEPETMEFQSAEELR